MSKLQPANKIIEEELQSRIGINPSPPASRKDQSDVEAPCLGNVRPIYEPLKVCLDDDTSDEENSEFDDDFFFGDGEDFETMAYDYFKKNPLISPKAPTTSVTFSRKNLSCEAPNMPPSVVECRQTSVLLSDESCSRSSSSISMASSAPSSTDSLLKCCQSEPSLPCTKPKKSKRRVVLDSDVLVLPIPSRSEYPDRIKEQLWSSSNELYQNAIRNSIEFASEGWNWRTVTEDENMIVYPESGELIHPVHLHNAQRMNATSCSEASYPVTKRAKVAEGVVRATGTLQATVSSPWPVGLTKDSKTPP